MSIQNHATKLTELFKIIQKYLFRLTLQVLSFMGTLVLRTRA